MLSDLESRLHRHTTQLESLTPPISVDEVRSMAASIPAAEIRVPVTVSHRRVVLAVTIAALALIAAGVALALRSEVVEEGPRLGSIMEMEIAPDGLPFLAYSDEENGGVVFAKCADRLCEDITAYTRFSGAFPSISMRPDGRPLIWIDGPDGSELGPWLLDCLDAACTNYITTEIEPPFNQAVALDSAGHVLLIYNDTSGEVIIGTCDDWACASGVDVVRLGSVDPVTGLLDAAGRPLVLFVDGRNLHMLRCHTDHCSGGFDDVIVATGDLEELRPFTAVVGDNNVPWFAYGRYGLQIARCRDLTCAGYDTVSLGDDQRAWAVSTVTAGGLPTFVYNWSESGGTDTLRVARCSDMACTTGTIATIARGRNIGSLAVARSDEGLPVIAYRSADGVTAISCGDPGCTEGALEITTWGQAPSTTLTTPTTQAPIASTWTPLAGFQEAFGSGSEVAAVTGYGSGVIAVGRRCEGESCLPTAWVSDDGRTWEAHPIDDVGVATLIVDGPSGLVAVGFICDGPSGCGGRDEIPEWRGTLQMWRSTDGATWERTTLLGCEPSDVPAECRAAPWRISGGAAGYVLSVNHTDAPITSIWASLDGQVWHYADLGLDEYDEASSSAVWSTQAGMVAMVRVGEFTEEGFSAESRLWSSSDAVTWTERNNATIRMQWGAFESVTWSGGALLSAQEWQGDGQAIQMLYTSPDGLAWTKYPWLDLTEDRVATSIVPFSEGLFALSVEFDSLEGRARAFTWTSSDGLFWQQREWPIAELPLPEDGFLSAPLDDGVLLIGNDELWVWHPGS